MSTLFSVPTTPSSQSRSSRSRYDSDTGSTHSHSYPSNIDPTLTQTPTPTHTQQRHHTNSVSSVRSQKTPRGTLDYHNNITGSPLAASPTQDTHIRTPFVQSAIPPSPHLDRQQDSPTQMPAYHPSPSPTATYGINGGLIVNSNASTMPTGNGAECQPLLPNQPDVFMNGKTGRPALRPSHSQNAVLVPASVNWNRRSVAEDPNSTHRPATTESIYNTTQQGTEHGHNQHEASAPFSHPQSVATHSSYPPAPPHPSSHPHSSSHTQSMPINSGNSYSDQEISYQSGSYAGSYDSSFGPNSPWIAPPSEGSYQQYQGHYSNMPASRIEEPILAPGEVPAPRPPMSYAALIGEALLHAPPPHQLYVSEISESIKRRYVYYRQNPSKVYNGVRHQTSMCKAFVKLSRPFGDQSGGARKWAIRAGCETWFQNGGCRQPTPNDLKKSMSPPPGSKAGKAKATARAKQLAIGTGAYHNYNRSPRMSHKVKQEPYTTASGPSIGPAFDGSRAPAPPAYPYHQYSYANQSGYAPGYHYVPMPHTANHPHPHGHPMMQQPGWSHQNGGYQAQAPPLQPESPSKDASPLMTPHPYSTHPYPQPPPGQQYWQPAPQQQHPGDYKPYASMPPPPTAHPYHQSDERGQGQREQHSPGSYEDHSPQGMRGRDDSAELSSAH